jgi:hypothetical protein
MNWVWNSKGYSPNTGQMYEFPRKFRKSCKNPINPALNRGFRFLRLEFCLKHTHKNCMNGLKKANPPCPPMYEFPLKSRFYITHLYRGFPGSYFSFHKQMSEMRRGVRTIVAHGQIRHDWISLQTVTGSRAPVYVCHTASDSRVASMDCFSRQNMEKYLCHRNVSGARVVVPSEAIVKRGPQIASWQQGTRWGSFVHTQRMSREQACRTNGCVAIHLAPLIILAQDLFHPKHREGQLRCSTPRRVTRLSDDRSVDWQIINSPR